MNNHHEDHKDQAIEILDAELARKEKQLREIDAEIEKLEGKDKKKSKRIGWFDRIKKSIGIASRERCKCDGEGKGINELMRDYERDVFGMWGGDKEKADAMTASEIQEKWEEHQCKMRDLGFF